VIPITGGSIAHQPSRRNSVAAIAVCSNRT
jgi:hypothetical protein